MQLGLMDPVSTITQFRFPNGLQHCAPARRDDADDANLSTSCDGEDASPQSGDNDEKGNDQSDQMDQDQDEDDRSDVDRSGLSDGDRSDEDEEAKNKKKAESSNLLQTLLGQGSGILKVFGRDNNGEPYEKALIADREVLDGGGTEKDRGATDGGEAQDAQDAHQVVEVNSTESVELLSETMTVE